VSAAHASSSRFRSCALVITLLALTVAVTPAAAASFLGDVDRLATSVDVEHPVDGAPADELRRRLAAFLAALRPPIALDPASPDRLRLTVAVRPYSSSALRGFPLPFSGTYGIGPVRLGVERAVHLPGRASPTLPAVVWQRELMVATRWTVAGPAIVDALGRLLETLREERPGPGRAP
jgi:hypothetical protein